ncbi:MAG: nucleotidyltransferase domain-containing protein [Nitrospiraceae bacterium]|nr:MAG: nucleotidyltransferase domain-containing protein [Nitrospiraceae bacterium]
MTTDSLTAIEHKMLDKFISLINNIGEIEAVYLFGSRARGEGHAESDIDVAVIVNSKDRIKKMTDAVIELSVRAEEETGVSGELILSPIVLDRSFLKSEIGVGRRVREEGILIWSRKSAGLKRKAI